MPEPLLLTDWSDCGPPSAARAAHASGALECLAIGYLDPRKNLGLLLGAVLHCRHRYGSTSVSGSWEPLTRPPWTARCARRSTRFACSRQSTWCRATSAATRTATRCAGPIWSWNVYVDHPYASGVLIDAIAAGRGLIAQTGGVIGHVSGQYAKTVPVPPKASPGSIAKAIAASAGQGAVAAGSAAFRVPTRDAYVEMLVQAIAPAHRHAPACAGHRPAGSAGNRTDDGEPLVSRTAVPMAQAAR